MENIKRTHSITVQSRSRTLVTGVDKVIDSSPKLVDMVTSDGSLSVRGDGLHILAFSSESGELTLEGHIDRMEYCSGKKPLIGRIFK